MAFERAFSRLFMDLQNHGGRDRGVVWKIMPVVDDGC